jgi:hypothetical protein
MLNKKIKLWLVVTLLLVSQSLLSAPKKVLLEQWATSDESSTEILDHRQWQNILDRYLIVQNRQSYFNYRDAVNEASLGLSNYIAYLTQINPLLLNRKEQQAYWINLYNAVTIQLVLAKYPITSITRIGKGFFSFGPWNDKVVSVNQMDLSLNDIEHGILRPIFNDPRIHYAVNCASLSCPNLLSRAFTAVNTNRLLEQAARDYINHPRGVRFDGDEWVLSTIYDWYQIDFGGNVQGMFAHIKHYAEPALLMQINTFQQNSIRYAYDWGLNQR